MKIVALCKTFAGEEWIKAMTLSIYPYVEKIVFVNSEISWTGRKGNSCREAINEMLCKNKRWSKRRGEWIIDDCLDYDNKIISLNYDTIYQIKQCMFGYDYIKTHIPCDYVMLIDTDEVWDAQDLENAIQFLKENPGYEAYRSGIYTYIKSPYWRVFPVEPLEPVCFIKPNLSDLGNDARCCGLPSITMKNDKGKIPYHHYVYVRNNFNVVLEKIISSHVSENALYEDMSEWIPNIWNKLPNVNGGFHPAIGYKRNWFEIETIEKDKLPKVLREKSFPIMEKFNNV